MKLKFEGIPEDYGRHLYYVEWYDTLGKSEGYLPGKILKRPKEIWCVVTDRNNDTLGYYCGLSAAQTLAYFQTTDTLVKFNFMIGLNMFRINSTMIKKVENIWKQIEFRFNLNL